MVKPGDFAKEHRRSLAWTAGLLCLYALLGFLLVPWLAERKLVAILQQRLDAHATVDAIHFNPFTFTASVELLDVQTADNTPLMSLQRLYLNVDPIRLLLMKIRIAEITVDTLQLHYNRYSKTDDTIARLTERWVATAAPPGADEDVPAANATEAVADDDELVRLQIGRVQYLNGSIHYRDEAPATDFATTLGPLNIDIADISTLDTEEKGSKDLVLRIEQDATLTWNSSFEIAPLQFAGHLALDNFSLTTPYRYFQDTLPFVLRDGRVAVAFDYEFSLDGSSGPRLALNNVALQIRALDAAEQASGAAFLGNGTLVLEDGAFVYPDMRAQATALRIDGMNIALERDPQGELNLQRMLNGLSRSEATNADAPATPLQLTLGEFTLSNTTIGFTDATTPMPATFSVNTQASLRDFTLTPGTALPLSIDIMVETGGTLAAQGTLQLLPALAVDVTLELAQLSLPPLQPYLDELAQITLANGDLGFKARLRSNSDEALSWQGDLTLDNLQLLDQQRAETLFSLTALRAGAIDFSLSGQRLDTSEVILDAPYGRVFIAENGISNIREAFVSATPAQQSATPAEPESNAANDGDTAPFAISLGRMQINGASSDFTDRSLPIVFDTKMESLDGEISGYSSTSAQAMTVGLEGQVNEFGLVEVSGTIDPLTPEQQTDITLAFTNLDLSSVTPYVIKFAGREIAEGKADVTLTYAIDDSELQANNSVVISDMRLGPRVEYPGAMELPLDLAVALLKNREGVIDLDVPVTGNVDDPQFDMGPVIRRAIFNVIVNIVTSPFRLLSGLVGGGEDEIDSIRFRPGRSDLAPPEQEKLLKLSNALAQRPQLALVVPAPFETTTDTLALQSSTVDARVEAQLALDEAQAPLQERRVAVLEDLYEAAMLAPTLEALREQFTPVPPAGTDEEDAPALDTLAYSAGLRDRLMAAEPVTESMLQTLARERQAVISAYLTMSGEITPTRLQSRDVDAATIAEGWISASFEVEAGE